ncbi:hypothetical protein MTO96_049300 [Rhipicephalus appendiculatus]
MDQGAPHGHVRERSVATIEGYGEAETMRFFIIVLIVVASMILVLLALILFGVMEVTYYEYPSKSPMSKSH